MEQVNSHNPDAVFVDGTGIGWGVHDRLNQLGCPNLVGVDFGARADRTDASDAAARCANKRAEMWGFLKEWLKVGSLPDDNELLADLKAVDYGYDASDAILLERKDDMRRRGLASPDDGECAGAHLRLSGRQARLGRGAAVRGRAAETEEVDCVRRQRPLLTPL